MRRRSEAGQIIAIFALAMALFLFGMVALVIDLSYELSWSTRVSGAAQVAAQSGANSVNPAYLYSGGAPQGPGDPACAGNTGILDTCRDLAACREAGDRSAGITASGADGGTTCRNVGTGSVHAEVVRVISLPLTLFGSRVVVRGTFDAAPVAGACAVAVSGTPTPCPR